MVVRPDSVNASPETEARFEQSAGESSKLRDSVAQKAAGLLPGISDSILSDIESEFGEGKKLFGLYNAVKDAGYRDLTEDEYALLMDFGCVRDEDEVAQEVRRETEWIAEKLSILRDAEPFWKIVKRFHLESGKVYHWLRDEYPKAFPEADGFPAEYECSAARRVLARRLEEITRPDYGNRKRPVLTPRGKEWKTRLSNLVNVARKRRSVDSESYADVANSGGIWIAPAAIAAFAVVGMTREVEEGGFGFSPRKTEEERRSDGGAVNLSSNGSGMGVTDVLILNAMFNSGSAEAANCDVDGSRTGCSTVSSGDSGSGDSGDSGDGGDGG